MQRRFLILGTVFPEPNSSAAGSRMLQLIELVQKQGWEITFATAAAESEYAVDLSDFGVKQVSVKLNDSSFDDFVRQLNPQMVLFDRFMTEEQFGWRVAENCPNAIRILDTEDLHCLRHARQEALKQNREFQTVDLFNELARREIASIYRCDVSLIISGYEIEVLKTTFKVDEALLHYLPFMLASPDPSKGGGYSFEQTANQHDSSPSALGGEGARGGVFEKRQHFVTIGNFLHSPNWDAVQYLKSDIWPLIRKQLPEAEMHVYGAYCSDKHRQLHADKDGFLIKGRAESATEVISNARVLLAPIRYGAGLKGKLVEAMQCGTPSVTTSIGAEAMHGSLPWSGMIADSPEDFAQAAIQLYTDKVAWEIAQQHGVEIIDQVYPKEELGNAFIQRLEELQANLETHRQQNFIGSMLMHHTMRSTEFMSRWIEAKNKL
ncbi:MAG: glycosyltransferase family 4 protein [Flavobacteriales bacterium]|nr:glycosyltransferase family 4 protein [Flavobacteriales bacterium]MCB9203644.1 glycosyltransferase family 4 protein [Flavobacteriales bacterium]